MTAGIITAKGNSNRLPGKNMLDFCGHPLTAWSIVQSVNSVLIDETYVSTDSEEIAEMSLKYGAQIIWRDYKEDELAPVNTPVRHGMRKLKAEKDAVDVVAMLPTSPLRLPEDIDNMVRLKREKGFPEVSSMVPHNEAQENEIVGEYISRCVFFDKTGRYITQGGGMVIVDIDFYIERTDFEMEYWTMDQLIELKKKNHAGGIHFFRDAPYYPLKIWQTPDIDDKDDFEWIKLIMEHYVLKGRGIEIYKEYYEANK